MAKLRTQLGYLTSAVENVAYVFVLVGVNAAAIIIATALFPIFYTAGIAFGIAGLKGRANRLAGPGTPEIAYPRFLPLGGKSQTAEGSSTGWFVGILWILQSESFLEVAMIFQIIPILLVPLQIIFNNVLEEVLSWLFGKYDLETGKNEPTINSLELLIGVLPCRIWRSYRLLKKWLSYLVFGHVLEEAPLNEGYIQWSFRLLKKGLSYLVFGKVETEYILNKNHAFINYIQGIDFSIDLPTLAAFPSLQATSKENALVLAKASQLSYNRIYLIRNIVNRNWSDVEFKAGWEFDYVSVHPPGSKTYEQKNSDISAVLLQVAHKGKGRALILAFRGTEPFKNVNWAVDFQTEPPPQNETWTYGVYHMGFRTALGLGPALAADTNVYARYLSCNATTGVYERKQGEESPFEVMREAIDDLLKPGMKLYVTGHSLGAALASIFTAALLVPRDTNFNAHNFGVLCTFGQPRVGDAKYTINLENALCQDRMDRRYMRVVNTDDIVCRMPPPQVTPPPWYADAPFWQHPGHLVFLPAVPARFKEGVSDHALDGYIRAIVASSKSNWTVA
ncbi:hypothetical protein WJX75_010017 [Coccomyxa subellipsoidea]|uniref:Fungal lipase-type domain-containing protein n=1 Tax=Coccomyxa subellipsoidea TaxID=248742 RepID=A0ABR2YWM4_9CHLO